MAGAIVPRLLYLFVGGDPQNAGDGMTDTYHHWQIAFLTKGIGLSHGFRLWDLKGVEYFWGLLHPIILVIAFIVFQSIDLVIPRLVSILFGSLSVVLLFQLCRRYWGNQVAGAVAAFAALAPPVVFTDALGMVEPVAVAFVLLGIYWWPARGFRAGVAWGLASMARSEAWVMTFGLLVASWFKRVNLERRLPLIIGWVVVVALYMKYLLDHTGNPVYPVYWEFLVEATGRWLSPVVTTQAHAVQPIFIGLVALSGIGLALTIWKRPESYLLLCYGFASIALVAVLLGFTSFISSWSGWVWRARILAFSFDFAFVLAAVPLFGILPGLFGRRALIGAWALTLVSIGALQFTWIPIQWANQQTELTWRSDLRTGEALANLYNQAPYRWGRLNIPADQPTLTYVLARFGGLHGDQLTGQLYDPFYDLPAGYRYDQDPVKAGRLMACWLKSTDTSVWLVPDSNLNYREFLTEHVAWFAMIGQFPERGWAVEAVSRSALAGGCSQ